MLQGIRDRATSWIVWVLIGLICAAFALTGLEGAANLFVDEDTVLEVGDRNWNKESYDRWVSENNNPGPMPRLQQLYGLATRWTDEEWTREAGYRVEDKVWKAAIRENPNYQKNGEFDPARYRDALATQSGITPAQHEAGVKLTAAASQMQRGLINSSFVVPAQVARYVELDKQQRMVQTAKVTSADFVAKQAASADDITEYYNKNKAKFFEPEQLQVDYVVLKLADKKAKVEVKEEQLKAMYEEQLGRFTSPNERRLPAHILVLGGEDPDAQDDAKEKATKILAEIKAGKSFADAAKEYSEDPSTKEKGGQLEWVQRNANTGTAFDVAIFALKEKGEISEPIKTEFGYHLIKLVDVEGSTVTPFADVKAELEDEYRRNAALDVYNEARTNLGREAATDKTLAEIAEAHGVTVKTSMLFSPGTKVGIAKRDAVRKEAFDSFADAELKEGTLSQLVEVSDDKGFPIEAYLMAKKKFVPRRQQEQAEVTTEITALVKQKKAETEANQVAADIKKALVDGKTVADVETAFNTKFSAATPVSRDETVLLPRPVVTQIFAMDKPVDNKQFGNFQAGQEHYLVILSEVIPGKADALADVARDGLRDELERNLANAGVRSLRKAMQNELGYKMDQDKAGINFGGNVSVK